MFGSFQGCPSQLMCFCFMRQVSLRARSIDPSTWQLSEELLGNYVPKSWLALLRLSGVLEDCSLERFQSILLDRLNAFSSWTEPEGSPHKLPLDKFLETKVRVVIFSILPNKCVVDTTDTDTNIFVYDQPVRL